MRIYFVVYSVGLVLLTVCFVNASKRPSSLVVANFGPRGNEVTAKTPHRLLVEYIAEARDNERFHLWEATNLVHFATRHVGRRDIKFSENWLQWLVGQVYWPMLQTQDSDLLIEGRLGNCSDRCQILKSVVELSGQRSRFVGLSGHVVLEVEIDGRWQVADPDYNITFPMDVDELAKPENEQVMRSALRMWYQKPIIDQYVQIVQTVDDNLHQPIGSPLSPRLFVAEQICKVLAWLLPCLFLLAVVPLLRRKRPGIC